MIKKVIEKLKTSKEFRDYIIWGVISAVLNVGIFQCLVLIGIEYKIANIITLVFNRIFCYLTNKFFVFHTRCASVGALLKEMLSFFLARMVTFLMDYFGVILMVEVIGMNSLISKIISAVIVIICNYIFSKLIVFRKKDTAQNG